MAVTLPIYDDSFELLLRSQVLSITRFNQSIAMRYYPPQIGIVVEQIYSDDLGVMYDDGQGNLYVWVN